MDSGDWNGFTAKPTMTEQERLLYEINRTECSEIVN